MKLFMAYVGERVTGCHLELHDIRFAIGNSIEECYDQIRATCWGIPEKLHLDCWGALEYADGYNITLKAEKPATDKKLFFVHLGGYTEDTFTEHHKNLLLVGEDENNVKKRALTHDDAKSWSMAHKDSQFDIDDVISVQDSLKEKGLYIHLEKTEDVKPFLFKCTYVPLGKK